MCLIVRGRIGDLLDLDLAAAQKSNNDGWGIHSAGHIAYSFSSQEKDIVQFLKGRKKSKLITIHFRWATHGTVGIENAHPFHLGSAEYLMHNGILDGEHFEHKTKSDTMRLVEILGDAGPLARDYILTSLADGGYSSNRFCVLKGNEWTKYGDWNYDKSTRTYHSNRSLLGGYKYYTSPTTAVVNNFTLVWDKATGSWQPKTPKAAAITRIGVLYDEECEVDTEIVNDDILLDDTNSDDEAIVQRYIDAYGYDDESALINDPFYVSER